MDPRRPSSPMPIHHALLALLADGESYGYELKGAFERSVGPQWGALNIGHLYQVLDRLKRDGHVQILRADPQPRRPDRAAGAGASAADGVALHPARVRARAQQPVRSARDRAEPPQRPRLGHVDVMAAAAQLVQDGAVHARLDEHLARLRLARIERA